MRIEETLQRWLEPLGRDLPLLYLVGGAVRDRLLGRASKDIDLMCAEPEAFARRLGDRHRAAVVPFAGKTEAPCFRVVSRMEKGDFIDVVGIQGGSVESDLARRDFTFNALAMCVAPPGRLSEPIDPFGGFEDLIARRVRATGPGVFAADPLRIVRAARFAAELGFEIDAGTFDLMRAAAAGLAATPGERIKGELWLVLQHPCGSRYVRILDGAGALEVLFPEIGPMKGCSQGDHHHLNVWAHSLAALEALEGILNQAHTQFGAAAPALQENLARDNRLPILKLALLLHDAGKPESRAVDPAGGRVTFLGHAGLSRAAAERAAERLKLASREREILETLVGSHMSAIDLGRPGVTQATLLRWFRRLGEEMPLLVLLSMADVAATRGPASPEAEREHHLRWGRETVGLFFGPLRQRLAEPALIDGNDLIAMGLTPGPELGRILRKVREAQDERKVTNREEALELGRRLMGAKTK
jgi:tRNA nucleotidyltransferase/poly(A) polymerase